MLYQSERHAQLAATDWTQEKAVNAIMDIRKRLLDNFDSENLWPCHPDEDSMCPVNKSIYFGAAGVLMALKEIELKQKIAPSLDYKQIIQKVYRNYLSNPDSGEVVPSLTIGESGILFLKFIWGEGVTSDLERLKKLIRENIKNPTLEALWGAPGTMLLPLYFYRKTQSQEWRDLFLENAEFLFSTWCYPYKSSYVWEQDLYGKKRRILGAGHGFIGNITPLLAGRDLLSSERQEFLLNTTSKVLKLSAIHYNGEVNWPYLFDEPGDRGILMQWCHGAPGIITGLKNYPKGWDPELDELLIKGGHAIWTAGPLKKGVGICHSTDGNGWAFLTLYQRTKDPLWLKKARDFAMKALTQRNGRYSLWTGEAGLMLFLQSCIDENDEILSLDYFA